VGRAMDGSGKREAESSRETRAAVGENAIGFAHPRLKQGREQ